MLATAFRFGGWAVLAFAIVSVFHGDIVGAILLAAESVALAVVSFACDSWSSSK